MAMSEIVFVILLGAVLIALYQWGFRVLPGERWQILATVPLEKRAGGDWRGLNLTWYGLFTATGYTLAVAVLYVLLSATHIAPLTILVLTVAVLAVCAPASSLVARVVEKKRHTFSVAGGFFAGVLIVPPLVSVMNDALGFEIDFISALAAAAIAYTFGEGIGRLACISFGCCYGKPLSELPPWAQKMFARWHFTFHGDTKKIAYASGMNGVKVLPIQGITAILYAVIGVAAIALFALQQHAAAFVFAMVGTQLWRAFSETLRADHRGGGKMSVYQWMALATSIYAVLLAVFFDAAPGRVADLSLGLHALWDPAVLLGLQALWIATFVYTGRSAVTESSVAIRVVRERI
jgi:prolipoprotein diacylglyceryltransferase